MRPMQKSPCGLLFSAGAFLLKADVLCEVVGIIPALSGAERDAKHLWQYSHEKRGNDKTALPVPILQNSFFRQTRQLP